MFNFDSIENYISNHLKLFISMFIGIFVLAGIIAVSVFFLSVRGAEQTMVPDITGQELSIALLELQNKELYPRLQLRYSQSQEDKGLVLEQDPRPGTIVKAGRRIRIVVSQGVMISRIESYLGKNIDETRLELQMLYSAETGNSQFLSIREPLMYLHSAEAPGTIIQQNPEPGTGIAGPTVLEFVVSRGPEDIMINIPDLKGLSLEEALAEIGRTGIDFVFSVAENLFSRSFSIIEDIPASSMTVVDQNPQAGVMVRADTRVSLTLSPPDSIAEGEVFNLFRYPMARAPYPMSLRLEAQLPTGETRRLLSTEYHGGELIVPYRLPAGTTLVLYLLNREIHRQIISLPAEPVLEILTLDQL